MQNGYIESFNGKMRDELLNETLFLDLAQARQAIAATDYNTARPHSSLGYKTPLTYATQLTATDRRAARDESSAHRPVAHTAPTGVTLAGTLVAAG
jgi:putative transposase